MKRLFSLFLALVLILSCAPIMPITAQAAEVLVDPALYPYPESNHKYGNNLNDIQEFTYPGASSLTITFNSSTEVERVYDHIYVYDGNGTQIVEYTGADAANKTLIIPGDSFMIKLTTDSSGTKYGYAFSSIVATIFGQQHVPAYTPATVTCTQAGLTEGSYCEICGEVLEAPQQVPALGHNYITEFYWSDYHRSCNATITCGRDCGLAETLDCTVTTSLKDETLATHVAVFEYNSQTFTDCKECDMYCVVFQNWDGTELSCEYYHYGEPVTPPANPTKPADNIYTYIFAGWDREVEPCTGDTSYTATYVLHPYAAKVDGKPFMDFEEALVYLQESGGSFIQLNQDAETEDLRLGGSATLDLNGYALTVDSILTFSDSHVTDSSVGNIGVLKIRDDDGNMLYTENSDLPVYDKDQGGYRFFQITLRSCAVTAKSKYWFKVEIDHFDALYPLIQNGAGVLFKAALLWDGQSRETYAIADLEFTKCWAERYKENSNLYVTYQVSNLQGLDNFTVTPCISANGVSIFGDKFQ